jgi:hypothetical protein
MRIHPKRQLITYVQSNARIKCDCGKKVVLKGSYIGNPYTGKCKCGITYQLVNNRLSIGEYNV